jgi:hypothetical protein
MGQSEKIGTVSGALGKAQAAMKALHKDANNPHFKSRYATLNAVLDVVKPVLAECGLVVTQMPTGAHQMAGLVTKLMHPASGEWLAEEALLPLQQQGPQAYVSAITYARRTALAAMFNLAADDDDGETAEGRGAWSAPQPAPRREAQAPGNVPARSARPPQTSSPATTGLMFPPYGRSKGQPVSGATLGDLQFYADGCKRTLDNPQKAQFHDKERTLLAAIEAEMIRQGAPPEGFDDQVADEPPF